MTFRWLPGPLDGALAEMREKSRPARRTRRAEGRPEPDLMLGALLGPLSSGGSPLLSQVPFKAIAGKLLLRVLREDLRVLKSRTT